MPRGGKRPGAGRKFGSKTKRTRIQAMEIGELNDLKAMLKLHPHQFMAEVLANTNLPLAMRFKAACELATYLLPRLRSVEHSGELAIVQRFQQLDSASDEELEALVAQAEELANGRG